MEAYTQKRLLIIWPLTPKRTRLSSEIIVRFGIVIFR